MLDVTQLSGLVISTTYDPPVKPVIVAPVCPLTFVNQFIEYAETGNVNPVKNIFPLGVPTQLPSFTTYPPYVNAFDELIITEAVIPVHPPPSSATT